jgi:hypothetical protein
MTRDHANKIGKPLLIEILNVAGHFRGRKGFLPVEPKAVSPSSFA